MSNAINQELEKAMKLTDAGVIIDERLFEELRDIMIRDTPMTHRVTRRPWSTNSYAYRRHTKGPGAFWGADGADLDAAGKSEFDKVAVPMKYIYSRVEVTGPTQASVNAIPDIMAFEIEQGAVDLGRELERTILFGDSATNSREFDGIVKQIDTNEVDLADGGTDGALFLSHLDEAMDKPHYKPNTIAGNRAFGRRVSSLLQAQQRFINEKEVEGGFTVMAYKGAPIYTLDHGHGNTLGNQVVLFDNRQVHLAVQKDVFVEKLAKTKDSDDYMIGMYATLAVLDENLYTAKIVGADFAVTNA